MKKSACCNAPIIEGKETVCTKCWERCRAVESKPLTHREVCSRAGKAGTGEAKRRGGSEYYRRIALKRWGK
jgi:hypothetical protein